MQDLWFIAAGFLVGLVVGLTGVGGGSLMTPILIVFLGVKPYVAVGTDLLFAAVTKSGGALGLARQGLVPWRVVGTLCAGSLPAAGITLVLLRYFGPSGPGIQGLITLSLGLALLLTACAMLFKILRSQQVPSTACAVPTEQATRARYAFQPVLLGAVIGTLVTLTSVGAGAIGVTVLLFLYPQLPLTRVVAADLAYAVPLTLLAGLGHATLGAVDWPLLALLLTGSLPGIWLGTRLMHKTPERVSRFILSLLLALAGSKLVFA